MQGSWYVEGDVSCPHLSYAPRKSDFPILGIYFALEPPDQCSLIRGPVWGPFFQSYTYLGPLAFKKSEKIDAGVHVGERCSSALLV